MAYVGISGELINAVERKIREMKDKERKAFVEPQNPLELRSTPQELIDLLWGEHINLKPLLPETWLVKNTSVDLHMSYSQEDGSKFKNILTIKYDSQMLAPPNTAAYRHDIYVDADVCPIPQAEAFFKWSKEMAVINSRWEKVQKQISIFLKSCKSLNEALKLWPDVRIYIPDEYIKRVERKVEREATVGKAAAALANVDTDAAISAAMTARLMGSMQGLT